MVVKEDLRGYYQAVRARAGGWWQKRKAKQRSVDSRGSKQEAELEEISSAREARQAIMIRATGRS